MKKNDKLYPLLEATKEYCLSLKKDNKTKRSRAGKAYSLNFGGRLQILKIYDFLYKDATIYLERKIQKFAVLR